MKNIIRTKRLILIPLELHELKMRLSSPGDLERILDANFAEKEIFPPLEEAYLKKISLVETNPQNFLILTYWQFLHIEKKLIIGEAGFKNLPDGNREVEIGYGIAPEFRGQGYAREGVIALAEWALKRKDIQALIATTDRKNIPSQRVLLAGGWEKNGEDGKNFFWRLERGKGSNK